MKRVLFLGCVAIAVIASCLYRGNSNSITQNVPLEVNSSALTAQRAGDTFISYKAPALVRETYFQDDVSGWTLSDHNFWRTTNGGHSWEELVHSSSRNLLGSNYQNQFYKFQVVSEKDIWLLDGSDLIHSDDGGGRWERQSSLEDVLIRSFHFSDTDHGWAVGQQRTKNKGSDWHGVAYKTDDGGRTWKEARLGISKKIETTLWDVCSIDANHIWIVGDIILETKDAGQNWRYIGNDFLEGRVHGVPTKVKFIDAKIGWILTNQGSKYLFTKNGGANWIVKQAPLGVMGTFLDLSYVDEINAFGVFDGIWHSMDGGDTWIKIKEGNYTGIEKSLKDKKLFFSGNDINIYSYK